VKINHSKPYFDASDDEAVLKVLRDHFASNGPQAQNLGRRGALLLGKKYAIPTQSGTDAITAALTVLGLKSGSKVVLPAYICSAPLDSLEFCGCEPVPVDVDKKTLALSIQQTNDKKNIDAVLAAHLFGIPAPLFQLDNSTLIEDCAQTLAISVDDHKVGSMGKIAICSFYATKLLTTGHGGLIAVDDEDLFKKIKNLFIHDKQDEWAPHLHFMMSDLNAALGVSQMIKLNEMLSIRQKIATRFLKALDNGYELGNSIYSRFIVVTEGLSDDMICAFNIAGIEAKKPVHKPLFQYLNLDKKQFPNAQWAHEHIISVPIYPGMTDSEIDTIETFLEANRHELRSWPPT
jgi:perosamine synthetase